VIVQFHARVSDRFSLQILVNVVVHMEHRLLHNVRVELWMSWHAHVLHHCHRPSVAILLFLVSSHGKVDVGMNRLRLDVMRNQMEDVHGHLMSAWIIRHQIVYCLVLDVCSVMSHAMIIINAAQKFVELMECADDLFFTFFLSFDLFF